MLQIKFTVIFLGTRSLASTSVHKQCWGQGHLWTTVPRNVIRNPDVGVWYFSETFQILEKYLWLTITCFIVSMYCGKDMMQLVKYFQDSITIRLRTNRSVDWTLISTVVLHIHQDFHITPRKVCAFNQSPHRSSPFSVCGGLCVVDYVTIGLFSIGWSKGWGC